MSEQKQSYMAELNLWSDANVVGPLYAAAHDLGDEVTTEAWERAVQPVLKAIRRKVRESYRNGRAAKHATARRAHGARHTSIDKWEPPTMRGWVRAGRCLPAAGSKSFRRQSASGNGNSIARSMRPGRVASAGSSNLGAVRREQKKDIRVP
jgi:hypothetical protein